MNLKHYAELSGLFKYPGKNFKKHVDKCCEIVKENYRDSFDLIDEFRKYVENNPLSTLEELYISTFIVKAEYGLDIGYVVFGEDYKRGEFLAGMAKEHADAGNDCGKELPDHLPNVLELIAKSKDQEFINELVAIVLVPALEIMLKGFTDNKNIYLKPLQVLLNILKHDFALITDEILKENKYIPLSVINGNVEVPY